MEKKIVKEIEDNLTARRQLKRSLESRLNKAESAAAAARHEMERATKADDENAYIKAADRERFNNSIINSCRERIESAEKVPRAEAKETLRQIEKAIEETEAEATKKAAECIKTFYNIATEANTEIDKLQALADRYARESGNPDDRIIYLKGRSELLDLRQELSKRKSRNETSLLFDGVPVENWKAAAGIRI